ncbi:MAG: prephenate dehydrogenase [Oscillospiraceae bacterium]
MDKTIGIVGLGLIGGSMAKAVKARTECRVVGFDIDAQTIRQALADGAIDVPGNEADFIALDLLLVSLIQTPISFICENAAKLPKHCVIIDLCGVKLVRGCRPRAVAGVAFIGGHPMAGREFSGYAYSLPSLFENASMILTPTRCTTPEALEIAQRLFSALGFGKIVHTTPENHDHMIAFTSQLAHVVSSAYIKSPEALQQNGYSAGSYKDLTRVAKLNEDMWTPLFLHNREPLTAEIDEIIRHLQEYRDAIADGDGARLRALLREGRIRKESIG